MQIIIDIPEDLYKEIKEYGIEHNYILTKAISNCLIIPKNHGRLIDADKLEMRDIAPEAWYSPMWGLEMQDIEDAPTIIEADKEN